MTAGGGRRRRPWSVLAILVVLGVAVAGTTGVARAQAPEAAPVVPAKHQELLERYAPVMAIRKQAKACEGDERFRPMRVDHVLGRSDVVLRDADGNVVKRAPTAADLAGRGPDHWLDLPGNPLRPGCSYEQWFRSLDATPSIYGRVTTQDGQLVAQYWFYWAFNQWNDLHESDWEMIQLHFDTDDVDEALRKGPSLYAYAQHEGAEIARAGDDKVEIVDGTHPVVYSSGGSHASYFSSTRWFGKSGATGFGCDDTTGPIERLRPEVVALPREAPATGEFAWLSYLGHWGQQERFFDDGPTGPAAKGRWDDPLGWVDDNGRASSVELPFATSGATRTFCDLSAAGSALFNRLLDEPLRVVLLLVAGLVALAVVVRFGSRGVLHRAARTWWRRRRAFLPLAAVAFAGGALAWFAQVVVLEVTVGGQVVGVIGGTTSWVLPVVTLVGALVVVPAMGWVVAASVLTEDGDTGASRALRVAAGMSPAGTGAAVTRAAMVLVVVVGLVLFVFPPLVVLASLWLVAPVASAREHLGARAALTRSRRVLRGHRWRALALTVTLWLVLSIGGLVGAIVLLGSLGFSAAALVVAAVNGFVTPYVALVVLHLYDDVAGAGPDGQGGPSDGPPGPKRTEATVPARETTPSVPAAYDA